MGPGFGVVVSDEVMLLEVTEEAVPFVTGNSILVLCVVREETVVAELPPTDEVLVEVTTIDVLAFVVDSFPADVTEGSVTGFDVIREVPFADAVIGVGVVTVLFVVSFE